MKIWDKIKLIFFGLLGGLLFALGIIVGVKVDKDIYIKGKLKQKTGKGGRSDIRDITSNINIKKTARKQKRKQRKLLRNINLKNRKNEK